MKKLFILFALVALPFTITSCGGDDDVSGGSEIGHVGKPLTKTELSDYAGFYLGVKDKADLPEELEDVKVYILGDGTALVLSSGADILGTSSEPVKSGKLLKDEESSTYAHTCKITNAGNGVFKLDVYGTLDVSKNSVTFNVGPMAKQELLLSALTSGVLTSTSLIDDICRDWNVIQTKLEVTGGDLGSDGYSKTFKGVYANDLAYIASDIDSKAKFENVKMAEHLGARCTKVDHITLSRTGKVVVAYSNGLVDVGDLLKASGNSLSINWPNADLSNEYLRGELGITAEIESNCLRLGFNSKVKGNVEEPYNVKVEFVLEWAN